MRIVHARLLPHYVFVSSAGDALLSNINMASAVTEDGTHSSSVTSVADEVKVYLVPEASGFETVFALDSTQGDVYSWAMTAVQILTGQVPFTQKTTNLRNFSRRLHKATYEPLQQSEFPPMKVMKGLTTEVSDGPWESGQRLDELWSILAGCWAFERLERPPIESVICKLEAFRPDLNNA
ncbi:hypothetical protein K439DRAFT_812746 [Ramaria rubella]|nr:hypothetical protein K439DRAFT_812746 [Ramaria rubella]